jgi:peptidoglycan L-alanyl-D-glutamate endopeptidase CwlK
MDTRSEHSLARVHADLCRVIRAAAQAPQPFVVVYGVRTPEAEREACASGHSTTMHSRHLPQAGCGGDACAIDVAALTNGQIDFAPGHEAIVFGHIWRQIRAAAEALNIPVEWGGDWKTFKDWGHVQLPWAQYP